MLGGFVFLVLLAALVVFYWDEIHERFSKPGHEKLATTIVQLRAEMMKKPVSERSEDLALIKRLETQYAFLTGDTPQINIPKPKLQSVDKIESGKVISFSSEKKLRERVEVKMCVEED